MAKVLIIRLSSIGDVVLTTPVIRCVKQQMEGGAEIHYLIKKKFEPVITANPYIDKIHTIENNVGEVADDLLQEGFDHIIDLHNNFRSAQVKRKLKTLSFTVNKINIRKWLMVRFKINKLPDVHLVDRYMETVKAFNIRNDGKGLDYFIPEKEEVDIREELPASHQQGYIAFVIGGTYATKRLPKDKLISVCRKIEAPIVLLGGKEDREVARKVTAFVGEKVVDACGKYSINRSASLVKQADKIITHDTGLMHIAAAFKKQIVSVWGNTIPEFGMTPYLPKERGKSTIVQVRNLPCRPCSKLGYAKCPKKHFYCMNLIDEEEVLKGLE